MSSETGQRVGDYEVLALLGSGGMGRVYKVRNVISNREEAMKILLPDFAQEQELAQRFMSEIRTLAGLDHPNIAQLRTAFQIQNQFVMVMEFVEGTTLDKMPALHLEQILEYSMQVLSALSYAHGKGVTHRDIKPANIMITSHGLVKLMDFGIAKSTNDMNLTRPGTTMGSIYYMSPEQVRGSAVDGRTDIYSFGVMLYEMLTGRKPFQADTSYSVLNAQLNEAPAPPAQWNPTIPAELNAIVLRAMAKDPSGRFQTADEFRNAIRAVREPKVEPVPAAVTMFEAVPATSWEPVSTHSPSSPGAPPMATQVISPTVFSPPVVAPAAQKSNRTLWITLGAVAAILVLAALATVLPRFFLTHAGQKTASVATDAQSSGSSPAQASAAGQTATQSAPSPQPDFAGTAMTSGKPARSSPPAGGNSSPQPVKVKQPQTTVSDQPANPTGQNPPPVNNSNPPAAQGPTPQQLREGHDRLINIDARADAARAGVQNIRSQQQAQGLDIRGDILASMTRMNRFLEEADHALSQRDLDSANDYMDRANTELARLESFLGR